MTNDMKRRILVVGGSKGLGSRMVELLSASHTVASAARTSNEYPLDLMWDADRIRGAVEQAIAALDGLDTLVISSGMGAYHSPLVDDASVKELFQVNVFGPLSVFQACLPYLVRTKGRVMVVTSTVARRPGAAGLAIYGATKGAMNSWVISEGRRVAKKGIALFAYAPGWFDSPMTAEIEPEFRAKNEAGIPFKRFATVDEVATFGVSLLAQANWTLAGQIFEASGGA
jgi:NAD(P)-dependent dehydrogenase (short-subunit alcohol dehydrogenase family)